MTRSKRSKRKKKISLFCKLNINLPSWKKKKKSWIGLMKKEFKSYITLLYWRKMKKSFKSSKKKRLRDKRPKNNMTRNSPD